MVSCFVPVDSQRHKPYIHSTNILKLLEEGYDILVYRSQHSISLLILCMLFLKHLEEKNL